MSVAGSWRERWGLAVKSTVHSKCRIQSVWSCGLETAAHRSKYCSCLSRVGLIRRSEDPGDWNQFPEHTGEVRRSPGHCTLAHSAVCCLLLISRQNTLLHSVAFWPRLSEEWCYQEKCDFKIYPGDSDDNTEWLIMNLCALTMRNNNSVRDDRPFSGPIKTYVAPFKGLKGGRNGTSVTYRSNFFQDDLDDPELAFDNNNTFRDECIARSMTDKMLHWYKSTRDTAHGKLFQIKKGQIKTRSCWFSKF